MSLRLPVALVVAVLLSSRAFAAEVDGCTKFTWDVTHELAVFKGAPQPVTAGTKAGKDFPQLKIDQVHQLELAGGHRGAGRNARERFIALGTAQCTTLLDWIRTL